MQTAHSVLLSKLVRFFTAHGRVGRKAFWLTHVPALLLSWAMMALWGDLEALPTSKQFVSVLPIILALFVQGRRWHDRDKSAWWALLTLVPFFGLLWVFIECGFLKGTDGPNRYDEEGATAVPVGLDGEVGDGQAHDESGQDGSTRSFYRLSRSEGRAAPAEVNRILGSPIGVGEEDWPRYRRKKMEHVLTLDLDTVPDLKTGPLAESRAVALFVSDLYDNEAWEPGTGHTRVVVLTQRQIDATPASGQAGYKLEVSADRVPSFVFIEDVVERSKRRQEYTGPDVQAVDFAGGGPIWIQTAEHHGHFVLQFSESLVEMNLGDAGTMYVFVDTAFWQGF